MTNGQVAEQVVRQRRYAELFAQAMVEPDERKRAAAIVALQEMIAHRSRKRDHQDA